jgi:hypothetical protein
MKKTNKDKYIIAGILIVFALIMFTNHNALSVAYLPIGGVGSSPYFDLIPFFVTNSSSRLQNSYIDIIQRGIQANVGWGFTTDYNNTPLLVNINTPQSLMSYTKRIYQIQINKESDNNADFVAGSQQDIYLYNLTQNYTYSLNTTNLSYGTYIINVQVGYTNNNSGWGQQLAGYLTLLQEQFYIAQYIPKNITTTQLSIFSTANNTEIVTYTAGTTFTIKGQQLTGGTPPYSYLWVTYPQMVKVAKTQNLTLSSSVASAYQLIGCDSASSCVEFKPIYLSTQTQPSHFIIAPPPPAPSLNNFTAVLQGIINSIVNFFRTL